MISLPGGSGPLRVLVTDLDRTLTDRLFVPVPEALDALREVRTHGVKTVVATGRTRTDLPAGLPRSFDAAVLEGGAVAGPWRSLRLVRRRSPHFRGLTRWLDERRIPYHRGRSWISVNRKESRQLQAYPHIDRFLRAVNHDRIDVTPDGVDKATGLRTLLGEWGRRAPAGILVFGDADNDLCLFGLARYRVAVRNATQNIRAQADEVTTKYGGRGVARFIEERLLSSADGG